jgi:diadenosine hexaphosphate hydrolase (ATP-forming)
MGPRALGTRKPARREVSAGGVLFRGRGDAVVLLHRRNNTWVMPKGHVEPGETADQAALREVAEETGLQARIVQKVGTTRYVFRPPWESAPIEKTVHWFLMEVADLQVALEPWFDRVLLVSAQDAATMLTYPADRDILRRAFRLRQAHRLSAPPAQS